MSSASVHLFTIFGSISADMNRIRKNTYFGFFAIPVIFISFAFLSCESDIETVKSFSGEEDMPLQTMKNAEIVYSDSGRVQIRIMAPLIQNYPQLEEPYLEMTEGIHVLFLDREGNVESELSSGYAKNYTEEKLWEVRDSVVVVNKLGEVLNTEQLFWDEDRRIIYSEKFVRITRQNEIIMGEGLEANQDLTQWKIDSIQGTIYLDDDE